MKRFAAVFLAAFALSQGGVFAQQYSDDAFESAVPAAKVPDPLVNAETGGKITINLASRILTYWEDGKKLTMYHVGVGRAGTPTPTGKYAVFEKEVNPAWISPADHSVVIYSGPSNPLGYRWMRFHGNYGIHGTNNPGSIGGYVSNGCVRLYEEDVEQLYSMVKMGTPVEVSYDRLVVETAPDGRIAYYVYPDGYGRQRLDIATVRKALDRFGVSSMQSDAEIMAKIEASDGEPTFLEKLVEYRLEINGLWVSANAVKEKETIYFPALTIAKVTKDDVSWDPAANLLRTTSGEAKAVVFHGAPYLKAEDTKKLFMLDSEMGDDKVMRLFSSRPRRHKFIQKTTAAPVQERLVTEDAARGADASPSGIAAKPEPDAAKAKISVARSEIAAKPSGRR